MIHVSTITTPPRFQAPIRVTLIGSVVTIENADEEQGTATRGRYSWDGERLTRTAGTALSAAALEHCAAVLLDALKPPVGLA
jgi:hypothetical protein